jgi:hypothetical protein
LHARARKIHERKLVLAWEYRQRAHSKGTWFRLRRALVDAKEAWEIGESDAEELVERGIEPLAVGRELEPPKRLFVTTAELLETLSSRRQIRVGLSADLLQAKNVVLVPFE